MKIRSISLQNFLCYYGTDNIFEFGDGLNIVLGANGYGKSKLFDAFQWIFNDVENTSITKTLKGNLVSEKAKSESDIGDMIQTKVILEVDSKSGKDNYQLIRSYKMTKRSDGNWNEPEKSTFQILLKDVRTFKPIPENEYKATMERLVPTDVRPYVWFQGEQGVSKLIDTRDSVSLKNLVGRLSNIDRWDKYKEVAEKAYLTAFNAFKKASNDTDKNRDEINKRQKTQDELTKDIQRIETTINEFRHNLHAAQEIRDKLTANLENAHLLERLKKEQQQIDASLQKVVSRIDDFYQGYSKRIFSESWLLQNSDFLIDFYEEKFDAYNEQKNLEKAQAKLLEQIGDESFDANTLPEGIPEPMHIKKMLLQERCLICNRPALKNSAEWKSIESRLPKLKIETEQKVTQNFFPIYNKGAFKK